MTATMDFKIGTEVKVSTPDGVVTGLIAWHYRNTNTNQFAVEFTHASFTGKSITICFSKKTGLPYMAGADYKQKYKVIF